MIKGAGPLPYGVALGVATQPTTAAPASEIYVKVYIFNKHSHFQAEVRNRRRLIKRTKNSMFGISGTGKNTLD